MTTEDTRFMARAWALARGSMRDGGLPIGAVLVQDGAVVGEGHNRLVQAGDPTAHGEIDCLRAAGRRGGYAGTTLYNTLSPCPMCAGAIRHFGMPRVVVGENPHASGQEDTLRAAGVEVVVLDDARCRELVARLIADQPALWGEDAGSAGGAGAAGDAQS